MTSSLKPAMGRRSLGWLVVAGLALGGTAQPVSAQIAWDTPRMIGPESPSGVGIYWLKGGTLPGDDKALLATMSLPATGGAVSLRGGFGDGVDGQNSLFAGVDVRAPLAEHTDDQPLDIGWSGGAGLGYGEYWLFSVPVAVSAGRSWTSGSVWVAPYLSVGAVADVRQGGSELRPDDEFDVSATAEVGVDVAFDRARRFVLRTAVALGDRQAVAVGMSVAPAR